MKNKLDVGCGKDYDKENYVGVDLSDFGQEVTMNIETDKLPFDDGRFDEIRCYNTLEHIHVDHLIFVMNEFHRVLKKDGVLDIIVPRFPHPIAIADPTHVSYWHEKSFEYWAGPRPKHTTYYDRLGRPMAKWAIQNDGKDNYTWFIGPKHIQVKLIR